MFDVLIAAGRLNVSVDPFINLSAHACWSLDEEYPGMWRPLQKSKKKGINLGSNRSSDIGQTAINEVCSGRPKLDLLIDGLVVR